MFGISKNELLHYLVVYGVLLAAWVPVMGWAQNDLVVTAAVVFGIFVATDKFAHKVFGLP